MGFAQDAIYDSNLAVVGLACSLAVSIVPVGKPHLPSVEWFT
jgi:hypothetical protein